MKEYFKTLFFALFLLPVLFIVTMAVAAVVGPVLLGIIAVFSLLGIVDKDDFWVKVSVDGIE